MRRVVMREQGSAHRSERSLPMNGIEKQAAFYRAYICPTIEARSP